MLFRIATARGHLLGKVEGLSVMGDSLYGIEDTVVPEGAKSCCTMPQ